MAAAKKKAKKKRVRKTRPPIKKGAGPLPKYEPRFADEARALCFVGATIEGLCEYFGVGDKTLYRWRDKYPEFADALKQREKADNNVIGALYKRAIGYQTAVVTKEMQTFAYDEDGNEVSPSSKNAHSVDRRLVVTKVVEAEEAPNPTAAIFWLKNRQRGHWKDSHEVEVNDVTSARQALLQGRERLARLRQEREDDQEANAG